LVKEKDLRLNLRLSAPQPLAAAHRLDAFECGVVSLDEWLKRRALSNQASGASRSFVVLDEADQVRGFYALAAGAVSHAMATSKVRRNMPDPIPVMVLARLAVDRAMQGQQLGAALLQDAVHRTVSVAHQAGVRALLVHAIDEGAQRFYERYGFQASLTNPLTLMLKLSSSI
jgi:predicted N-acetyltransferase YhbS